jgi:hypothetical protein
VCNPKKTTRPTENEQKNERQNANASAKSKELHPHAQSQRNAAHLLLPQRTERQQTKFDRTSRHLKINFAN